MIEPAAEYPPDEHLKPEVAAAYDSSFWGDKAHAETIEATVELLAELAASAPGPDTAVEFAIGTGRIGLPLSQRGVTVHGIDFSEPMLDQLRPKPGADQIELTVGDMTTTHVGDDFALAYLVFNTITNLRTQQLQVECFANAAAHLRPGGHFVVEVEIPELASLAPGETLKPFDLRPEHVGISEYRDRVAQIQVSHHWFFTGDSDDRPNNSFRAVAGVFRYVWPSELDLMAQLAGMTLVDRFSDWNRAPFTGESTNGISIWRKD